MKSVLIDIRGHITDIVEPGEEFAVYNGPDAQCKWVTCHVDEVQSNWILSQKTWVAPDKRYENGQDIKRQIAYGEIGEQLDMLYKDQLNGTTNWRDHITNVKTTIESSSAWEANPANKEGKTKIILHTDTNPSWLHLPEGENIIENIPTGIVYATEE